MGRLLRYEAVDAVDHVMPRGDGGKNVFDVDEDRFAWTDLMEKAHGRFGPSGAIGSGAWSLQITVRKI